VLLLVLAYPGSPGPKAIKRLCVYVCGTRLNATIAMHLLLEFVNVIYGKLRAIYCKCVWLDL